MPYERPNPDINKVTIGNVFSVALHVAAPVFLPGIFVGLFWLFGPLWLFLLVLLLMSPILFRAYLKSWSRWKEWG